MKKHLIRAVLWVSTLMLMAAIFGFSGQTGEESGSLSAIISQPVTDFIASRRGSMTQADVEQLYQQVDHVVRKCAHFAEYGLLGLLLALLFDSYGRSRWLWPYLAGTGYAVLDEVHQLFIAMRTGQLSDVLLDSAGVFCGVMLPIICKWIWRKKHVYHQ